MGRHNVWSLRPRGTASLHLKWRPSCSLGQRVHSQHSRKDDRTRSNNATSSQPPPMESTIANKSAGGTGQVATKSKSNSEAIMERT